MSRRTMTLVALAVAAVALADVIAVGVSAGPRADRGAARSAATSVSRARASVDETSPAGAAIAAGGVQASGGGSSSAAKAGGQASSPGSPPPGTPAAGEPAAFRTGELALAVSVNPGCAAVGDRLTAVITAPPGAYVSLVVSYADGRNYGEMYAGPVSPDGSLTYPWVVPATAKTGPGRVLVAGHDPAGDRSGTNGSAFTVAKEKKQC